MLASHKIIDSLRGHGCPIVSLPGVDDMGKRNELADLIQGAMKFDYGDLALEPKTDEGKEGVWKLPTLTTEEREFWRQGLIPLPYPTCWYEFVINGWRSGILVIESEDNNELKAQRVDYLTRPEERLNYDGVWVSALRTECPSEGNMPVKVQGNAQFLAWASKNANFMHNNIGMTIPLVIYLTLMINSKSTERRAETAPSALNKKRERKGLAKLADHLVVTIVPEKYIRGEGGEGTHKSPRLHWRRSHLRHYESGKTAVIPRHLVGKAELGEVSHEYRIKRS